MKSLIPLLWILVVSTISILLEQPIQVKLPDSKNFSAVNALEHIEIMASEVHFMGTQENRKVKEYIIGEFEKLNIPTEIFTGYTKRERGNGYIRMGRTENIIATLKGKFSKKTVLIVGHYDSVISSPGAADDVHSVACILETARLLTKEQLENDIIFLITDGEEMGLLGAKAFTEMHDLSNIGVVLNYEARGNSGPSISFEWSDGNAWLVKQLKKAGIRPIANSMSYEIYKNLPNDTDFTYFKKAGLSGINNAFIDGFSYYHNPADTPENINLRSVQHTGENMWRMARHMANIDLSQTVANNASFFNILGHLVIYPSSLDLGLLILTISFLILVLYKFIKSNRINITSLFKASLFLLGAMLTCILLSFGLSKLLFIIYPQYDVFYAGQFYNHKYYLLTCLGISSVIMWITIRLYAKQNDIFSLKLASLVLLSFLCILFFVLIPTASYFMLFPTFVLTMSCLIQPDIRDDRGGIYTFSNYGLAIIPIAIWTPATINIFLAFSLLGLPGPSLLIAIICMGTMIFFERLWLNSKAILYAGLTIIIVSMIVAHICSSPSEKYPLPSSAFFHFDADAKVAHWVTEDNQLNIGNQDLLKDAGYVNLNIPHSKYFWASTTDVMPHISTPQITIDTTGTSQLIVKAYSESYLTRIYLNETSNLSSMNINGQSVFEKRDNPSSLLIDAYAMHPDSIVISLVKKDTMKNQLIGINSYFRSLPDADILPPNANRVDGYTSIVQEVEL